MKSEEEKESFKKGRKEETKKIVREIGKNQERKLGKCKSYRKRRNQGEEELKF